MAPGYICPAYMFGAICIWLKFPSLPPAPYGMLAPYGIPAPAPIGYWGAPAVGMVRWSGLGTGERQWDTGRGRTGRHWSCRKPGWSCCGMAGAAGAPAGFHSGAFALSLNSLAFALNLNGFLSVGAVALGFCVASWGTRVRMEGGRWEQPRTLDI